MVLLIPQYTSFSSQGRHLMGLMSDGHQNKCVCVCMCECHTEVRERVMDVKTDVQRQEKDLEEKLIRRECNSDIEKMKG